MDDAERQGRISELLRIRTLQADNLQTIDKRLESLGTQSRSAGRTSVAFSTAPPWRYPPSPPKSGGSWLPTSWWHWTTRPQARTSDVCLGMCVRPSRSG